MMPLKGAAQRYAPCSVRRPPASGRGQWFLRPPGPEAMRCSSDYAPIFGTNIMSGTTGDGRFEVEGDMHRTIARLIAVAVVLLRPCVSGAWAACTVTIEDKSPIPGDTKNIGQEITLEANVAGDIGPIVWYVEDQVVDDYREFVSSPFEVIDHVE